MLTQWCNPARGSSKISATLLANVVGFGHRHMRAGSCGKMEEGITIGETVRGKYLLF